MLSSERPPETVFELKKDINTPSEYIRAGEQKTKAEWEKMFPKSFIFNSNEWFIDMTPPEEFESYRVSPEEAIVNEIFKKKGLHSMSYREAAIEAVVTYKKRGTTFGKAFGLTEKKISEEDFRNFLRAHSLTAKWEKYLKINNLLT